jgi:Ca2+-binding EF-hand superfamily protein
MRGRCKASILYIEAICNPNQITLKPKEINMKSFVPLTTVLALAFLSGCAAVENTYEQTPLASAFDGFDTDDDGVISDQEAQEAPSLAQNFGRVDTNHSGGIDPDEFTAASTNMAPLAFNQVDINEDGVISEREAAAMPVSLQNVYSDVDADGDNNVSPAEYAAARTNLFQGVSFTSLDTDHDGVLGEVEAQEFPPLSDSFTRVDADEDGLISEEEFAVAQR